MKKLKLLTRHFPFSPQRPRPHFLALLAAGKIPAFSSASHLAGSRPTPRRLPFATAPAPPRCSPSTSRVSAVPPARRQWLLEQVHEGHFPRAWKGPYRQMASSQCLS